MCILMRSGGAARVAVVSVGIEWSEAAQMAARLVPGRGGSAERLGQGKLFSPSCYGY